MNVCVVRVSLENMTAAKGGGNTRVEYYTSTDGQ
jgi:hypothetical protein